MLRRKVSPDTEAGRAILDELWKNVLNEEENERLKISPEILELVNCNFVGIRYCLPTQLLGKLTDKALNCLCLQKNKSDDESRWDPRSFAKKVIVPWVSNNQNVLGTSAEPYVGKPLRRLNIEPEPADVKGEHEWKLLYAILNEVEEKNQEEFTKQKFTETLRAICKRMVELNFEYIIPDRISMERVERLIEEYLSEQSGGARALSVAAALFCTFGRFFGIFSDVRRGVINASDDSTGIAGDLECIGDDGSPKLAVEVKDRMLTLVDVKSSVFKARKASLSELLFNAPGNISSDDEEIKKYTRQMWTLGMNIYSLSITDLVRVGLPLAGESSRTDFLKNIGFQLDTYNTQPGDRKKWKDLLEKAYSPEEGG